MTVTSVVGTLDGIETAADEYTTETYSGFTLVTASGGEIDTIKVSFTVEMPDAQKELARLAVKLLVAHWYENREASTEGQMATVPLAFDAIIAPLRNLNP